VVLADDLVDGARTHPGGKWGDRVQRLGCGRAEQV
jgi:hypothetical protein